MSKVLKIMKKIKIKNIIILIVLLVFNTYAWFLFNTRVATSLTAHVTSWKVDFKTENGIAAKEIVLKIDKIFPGMMQAEKTVQAVNDGETEAVIEYELKSVRIMDTVYSVDQGLTPQQLEEKLKTEFPFKTNIIIDQFGTIPGKPKEGQLRMNINWPYESGNDAVDTEWGTRAYNYYETNPDTDSVEIKLILIARQKN